MLVSVGNQAIDKCGVRGPRHGAHGVLTAAAVLLITVWSATHAGNPPPPEDEWWKRGKVPKPIGPITWSIGFFAGQQDWTGLEDLSPTPDEIALGWQGQFDPESAIYGVDGWMRVGRYDTIDLGFDMFVDRFSNSTSEPATRPGLPYDPQISYTIDVWRLGIAARPVFRTQSRFQPTASLGIALGYVVTAVSAQIPGAPYTGNSESETYELDSMLTVGCDVPFGKDPGKGWRARLDLGVERRPYGDSLGAFGDKSPGVLAYKAEFGFVYRHRPKSTPTPP